MIIVNDCEIHTGPDVGQLNNSRVPSRGIRARSNKKLSYRLEFRNNASAMHFFASKLLSIAVITYSYVYHPRSLRTANLLFTANKLHQATASRAHDARPHCRLSFETATATVTVK